MKNDEVKARMLNDDTSSFSIQNSSFTGERLGVSPPCRPHRRPAPRSPQLAANRKSTGLCFELNPTSGFRELQQWTRRADACRSPRHRQSPRQSTPRRSLPPSSDDHHQTLSHIAIWPPCGSPAWSRDPVDHCSTETSSVAAKDVRRTMVWSRSSLDGDQPHRGGESGKWELSKPASEGSF